MPVIDRAHCEGLDREDPLAPLRARFRLPEGILYLDGNSLGALPRSTWTRLERVVCSEWQNDLNTSWWKHGWLELPGHVGDKIGRLVGAAAGQVVVADSTSVSLFKLLSGALRLRPGRHVILSDTSNFPSDLYIAEGLTRQLGNGYRLRTVPHEELAAALDEDVAVVMLSHVDYRSARLLDIRAITERAHAKGALALWDLSHSTGVLPLALDRDGVDLAVGCGYKYLNGGPGAPAYVYVATRLLGHFEHAITGWLGHRDPFSFTGSYEPDPSIIRLLTGCPPLLSLVALEEGVDLLLEADMAAMRAKSTRLTGLFIDLVRQECPSPAMEVASPLDAAQRGSHVSLLHPKAKEIAAELARQGVIIEYRAPDMVRFGFAPLYVRFADVWDAVQILRRVMAQVAGGERQGASAGMS